MVANNGIIAISGFKVKTMTTVAGSGEESVGSVKLVIVADKDELTTTAQLPSGRAVEISDTIGCINRHQSDQEAVAVRLRFGQDNILPVVGFKVISMVLTPSKEEGEHGSVKLTLKAEKDELHAAENDITTILGAMSMHQSTGETAELQLRFT